MKLLSWMKQRAGAVVTRDDSRFYVMDVNFKCKDGGFGSYILQKMIITYDIQVVFSAAGCCLFDQVPEVQFRTHFPMNSSL